MKGVIDSDIVSAQEAMWLSIAFCDSRKEGNGQCGRGSAANEMLGILCRVFLQMVELASVAARVLHASMS